MLRFAVLIVCLASASLANNFPFHRDTIAQPRADEKNYLLSGNFQPVHYDLTVTPNLEDGTFTGTVIIDLTVMKETDTIDLHGHEISFDKSKVTVTKEVEDPNPETFTTKVTTPVVVTEVTAPAADDDTHFYKIKLAEPLALADQSVKLTIIYTGSLGGNNVGFYKATYLDKAGNEKVFATTDFEPTNARQAFPCFDQPDMKATFQIHIVRKATYTSISNMPLLETKTLRADTVIDTFEKTTVKMPTYLVAFVVSDMTAEELADTTKNRKYRVYGIPHLIEEKRGKYAVDSAKDVIDKIETFLNTDADKVPYSLPKLDQIAIPDEYFSAGAMENWGLVTYKQRYLLQKDGVTTASEKQNILSIIAHELGHQWFGNIATPKSWEHLWLSEGFATYFEQWAANEVDSDMRMMEQYVTLVNHRALESDAGDNTRPMNEEAGSPKEISALFDTIAYEKGGAVIRMMENFLTTDIFKTGLNNYLKAMAGSGSAEPDDLWTGMDNAVAAVADATNKPNLDDQTVKEIMDIWYTTKGYPVVTVSRVEGKIKLEQDRFLFSKATSGENTKWTIPINYVIEADEPDFSATTATHWLKDKTLTTEIALEDEKWIILNNQETGYYRVNYEETLWNLTIDYMNANTEATKDNYKKIHVLNRAQLIDDSFALARSGRISYSIPLRLCEYLTKETDYIPLVAFINSIQFLNNRLAASEEYEHLKTYVKDSLRTAYTALDKKREKHDEKLNWNNVVSWMCRYKDTTCQDKMHNNLNAVKIETVDPDVQTATYCGGMRKPDSALTKFKQLHDRYTNTAVEYLEKERVLAGMSCTFNEEHLGLLLDAAIGTKNDYEIAEADRFSVFTNMYTSSDVGLDKVLNFIVDKFEDVKTKLGDDNFEKLLNGVASRTSSQKHLDKLKTVKDNDEILKEPLATITANVKWATEAKVLKEWLVVYGSAGFVSVSLSLLFGMLLVVSWL